MNKTRLVLAVVAIVVSLSAVAVWAQQQPYQRPGVPPYWQYRVEVYSEGPPPDATMNEWGQAGWELVSVVTVPLIHQGGRVEQRLHLFLRRPISNR